MALKNIKLPITFRNGGSPPGISLMPRSPPPEKEREEVVRRGDLKVDSEDISYGGRAEVSVCTLACPAHQERYTKQPCVLKRCERSGEDKMIQRCLRHSNLMTVYCRVVNDDDNSHYGYVMERLQFNVKELTEAVGDAVGVPFGPTNEWATVPGALPEPVVSYIITALLKGLALLHLHYVHRDIKMSNIMMTCDNPKNPPDVKVCDFGLVIEPGQRGAQAGAFAYLSPENRNATGTFAQAGDIWAVALCAVECSTGIQLRSGIKNYTDVCERIPEILSLSEDLQSFLKKCLVEESDKRLTAQQALKENFCVKYTLEFGEQSLGEYVASWLCDLRRECQQQYATTTDDYGSYMEEQFMETLETGENDN